MMLNWRQKDLNACMRYRDGSIDTVQLQTSYGTDASEYEYDYYRWDVSTQSIPYATINFQHKVAAILYNLPELHITLKEGLPDGMEKVPATFLKELYENNEWKFVMERVLLKRFLSGKGCTAILWSEDEGVIWEQVSVRDLSLDPNVTRFNKLRWGARRILIPKDEARDRFRKIRPLLKDEPARYVPGSSTTRKDLCAEIWVYWDGEKEVHTYNKKVIEDGDNLYKRVPLHFLAGDIDPNAVVDLGDYDVSYGMQTKLAELMEMMLAQATHGGAWTVYDPEAFDVSTLRKIENGVPNQLTPVKTSYLKDAVHRLPVEPVNPVLMQAIEKLQNMNDAAQGVGQYERGVVEHPARTATEAALTAQLRGARANKQKTEFERYIAGLFKETSRLFTEFTSPQDESDWLILEALKSIQTVSIVEDSMVYKDPQSQVNTAVLLLQQALPLASAGLPINVLALFEKLLRASGETNTAKYIQQVPQEQGPGQPPGPPGADPSGVPSHTLEPLGEPNPSLAP